MLNKKVGIILGIVIIAIAAGAIYWWRMSQTNSANSSTLTLYGNVDIREVRLAFNASEHVAQILVHEGDYVQPGQLLALLHTERLQANLDKAKADLMAFKAEANAAFLSYKRIKSLAKRKLASAEEEEVAEAKSRAAAAHVTAAEAMVKVAEQALKDTQLYAPSSGIIRERIVEEGDFVTPQNPALTLSLTDPVWVRTYLPETYLGKVKPGMPAFITTDSFPNKKYQGWIGYVSPTAEFTPKNVETPELRTRLVYQVRVFACNPKRELRLGMPATVTINLQSSSVETTPQQKCQQTR